MHDVIVIGGGPSGLNTARRLSEYGLDVLVLEKKADIGRNIICTGILGKEAFDEFDLTRDAVVDKIKEVRLVSPVATTLVYNHPSTFAYVVNRGEFDRGLADMVFNRGGKIAFEHQVTDITADSRRVTVCCQVNGKELVLYSRMVVLATGVNHSLNRKLGLGKAKDFLNAAQIEMEADNSGLTTIYFGNDVAPGVFAWKVPAGPQRMRIGLLTGKDPGIYLRALLNKLYPGRKIGTMDEQIQFKSIAQGAVSRSTADRILAVGEAGGQVKTTTGGGIYFGLLCSHIAADVIIKNIEADRLTAKDFSEYERLWKKAILKEIQIGYYVRKLCARLNDSQIEKLFLLAKNNGIFPYIQKEGEFDWHGDLILSLVRKTPLFRSFL